MGESKEESERSREKAVDREKREERAKRGGDGDGNGGDNGGDARRTANKMAASSLSVHGSVGASIRRQHDSASDEQSRIECSQNEMRLRVPLPCRPGSFVRRGWDVRSSGAALVSWDRRHGESGVEKRDVADFLHWKH